MMNVWGQLPSKAVTALFPSSFPKPHLSKFTHLTNTIVTDKAMKGHHLITEVVKHVPVDVVRPDRSHATVIPATKIAPASPSAAQVAFESSTLPKSSNDWYLVGSIALLTLLLACGGLCLLLKYRKHWNDDDGNEVSVTADVDTTSGDDGSDSLPVIVISSESSEFTSTTASPSAIAGSPAVSPIGASPSIGAPDAIEASTAPGDSAESSIAGTEVSQPAAAGTLNVGSSASSNLSPTQFCSTTTTTPATTTVTATATATNIGSNGASTAASSSNPSGQQNRDVLIQTIQVAVPGLIQTVQVALLGLLQTIQVAVSGLIHFWTLTFFAVLTLLASILYQPSGGRISIGLVAFAKFVRFSDEYLGPDPYEADRGYHNCGTILRHSAFAASLMFAKSLITGCKWVYPYLLRFGGFLWSLDYRGYVKGILQILFEVYDERGKARLQRQLDAGCQCPASICKNNLTRIALDKSTMEAKDREIAHLTARNETLERDNARDKVMHRNSVQEVMDRGYIQVLAAEAKTEGVQATNEQLRRQLIQARGERPNPIKRIQTCKVEEDPKPCTNCERNTQATIEVCKEKAVVEENLKGSDEKLVAISAENTELRKQLDEYAKTSNDKSEGGCQNCAGLRATIADAEDRWNAMVTRSNWLNHECTRLTTEYNLGQKRVQDLLNEGNLQKFELATKLQSCNEQLQASQWKLTNLQIEHSSCTADKDTLKQLTSLHFQHSSCTNENEALKQRVDTSEKGMQFVSKSWRSASCAAYHAAFPHGSGARMTTGGPTTMALEAIKISLELQHGIQVTLPDLHETCNDQEKQKQLEDLKDESSNGPGYGVRQLAFILELWSKKVRTPVRLGQMLKTTGLRKTTCDYITYGHPTAKRTVWVMCQIMDDDSQEWFGLRPNPPSGQEPPAESTPTKTNETPSGPSGGAGRAETEYNMRFSNGFRTLKTGHDGLLCGLYAPIETMKAMKREKNYRNLLVPTFKELKDIWTSPALQNEMTEFFGKDQINNLEVSQIGRVLDIWGKERDLVLQIGVLERNNASFQTGTRGAIKAPFLLPHPEADDPICMVIWIHNDSAQDEQRGIYGHWSGVMPN
ncbi:MAG: hypothetical protein Q9182_002483 [Xanthomendoza sp. 2 TL-2023]